MSAPTGLDARQDGPAGDAAAADRPARLFTLDARGQAMLGAMGVRLDWLADLQRKAARAAAQGAAPAPSAPGGPAGAAPDRAAAVPAPDGAAALPPGQGPADQDLSPREFAPAAAASRTPLRDAAAQPPSAESPAPARGRPTALMPGAQTLLADAPRLLHGPADATGGWLVVADMAPDALGRHDDDPRAGDEGRLLDAMLRALQLHAGSVPVHLVRLHRGAAQTGSDVPRPWDEVFGAQALPLAPRVVLALGPLAAQALLRRDGPIGKLRGQAQPLDEQPGAAPVVASYHPAFLLKNAPAKAKAWADLCLAASLFDAKG
ncbi:uracil-DNA glycosylase family protein [Variovorax sp.]|uniref:uracil-DNA glycosylase family protein n=1 Tax=Variovorax sp. TaxID=1871043 RepID=UPI002D3CBB5D|nr:uracil-DNA glycosylase family protein [Variovorax sp.]HYP83005.1 uracil-DNA glycosylase family protein [Variovorax sp.]